jgi:hypothetical protein
MNDKYGTIQFFHDPGNGITYAVDVGFNREDLLEAVHLFDEPINLMVGKSFVHPNDTYCHKIGREVSQKKCKPIKFKLTGLDTQEEKIFLTFESEDETFVFRVNKHSEKPHLIHVRS